MQIYLVGFMGAGKTTVGELLSKKILFRFLDLDDFIEDKHQQSIPKIFREFGEQRYRLFEKSALADTFGMNDTIISTGGGVPCYFDNIEQMKKRGTTIYLKFPAKTLAERIKNDKYNERPLAKNKTLQELEVFVKEKLAEREVFYSKANFIVEPLNSTPEEIVNYIIKELKLAGV